MTDVSTDSISRPEGRIAYQTEGAGPLVLCIPGMGELRTVYRFTVPALVAAGFRVAVMDLRGHGDSDAGFSAYDDVAAGQDALALIEELGGGPAVLVGNSMGAGAAVWAAAERPEVVGGLVLVGPFVRNPKSNPLLRMAFRLAMSGPWAVRMWLSYLPKLYPGRKPDDFADHLAEIDASMRRPGYAKAFTATTRTSHAPAEDRLPSVAGKPVFVVMGERDPDFSDPRAEAAWIADRTAAEVEIVPGAGHYPQVEYPDVVNPLLVTFVQKVLAGA
jgi:pimeloyl-ACP methyl ester carboxylesterase